MNHRTAVIASGFAAALALVPMTAANAAPKPQVNSSGLGTYTIGTDGAAVATGTVTGAPFDGTFTARLRAQDGTLPAEGECEPGTLTLRIDGSRGRYIELSGSANVCGKYLQPPLVVTHQLYGGYDVASSSERRLRAGDGWFEIVLANDGRAGVTAIDT